MEFEPVIGLEVHAQLKTRTKIFCGCPVTFGRPPNSATCPVCLGMPGALPVLNENVVLFAVKLALATDSSINQRSIMARKNYFYPDLPKGYQISQYELPIAEKGHIDIDINGKTKRIGLTRIHMEEDAGKLIHQGKDSLVDLNRAGVPLLEIVSEPQINSPEEAAAYLKKLRNILRYLEISDGNMEEGSFRCDANVSVRIKGDTGLGTRTEVKNLNSFKHVEKAIAYEIDRQCDILYEGEDVVQETRLWNPEKGCTESMRGKEEAHDYRYFPDPDLVPVVLGKETIDSVAATLPELPDAKKRRYIQLFKLKPRDAEILVASKQLSDFFEECTRHFNDPVQVCNWVVGPLSGLLNSLGITAKDCPVAPDSLGELLGLVKDGTLSSTAAKTVLEKMAQTGKNARKIVHEENLVQLSDESELEDGIRKILGSHPEEAAAYRAGKKKLIGFFMGQAMKAFSGRANPEIVKRIITRLLEERTD